MIAFIIIALRMHESVIKFIILIIFKLKILVKNSALESMLAAQSKVFILPVILPHPVQVSEIIMSVR
ncbi:hypothetical protein ADP72_10540 [Serratia plymuthica]|nr:hypothetical protein ADP72_10540 [Serratia plymuthica]